MPAKVKTADNEGLLSVNLIPFKAENHLREQGSDQRRLAALDLDRCSLVREQAERPTKFDQLYGGECGPSSGCSRLYFTVAATHSGTKITKGGFRPATMFAANKALDGSTESRPTKIEPEPARGSSTLSIYRRES